MRIIHFSDPHITSKISLPAGLFDKRIFGTLNYFFRRRGKYPVDRLKRAVHKILELNPQVVICTGDIASTSEPEEFAMALKILAPLLKNDNIHFFYVPGNHDAYVSNKKCSASLKKAFSALNNNAFTLEELPFISKIHNVSLFLANECSPTNPVLSCGYISDKTSNAFVKWIGSERKHNEKKIFIGHFPTRGITHKELSWRRRLNNSNILYEALQNNELDILLCGHIHTPYINHYGKSLEICAGSITFSGILNIIEIQHGNTEVKQYWEMIDDDTPSLIKPDISIQQLPA